jgi:hypothetical protein
MSHAFRGQKATALPGPPALSTPIAVPRDHTNHRVTIVVDGMSIPAIPAAPRTPKHR